MSNKERVRSVEGLSKEEELKVVNESLLPLFELLDELILPRVLGPDWREQIEQSEKAKGEEN